jgi:hypothetical protein
VKGLTNVQNMRMQFSQEDQGKGQAQEGKTQSQEEIDFSI